MMKMMTLCINSFEFFIKEEEFLAIENDYRALISSGEGTLRFPTAKHDIEVSVKGPHVFITYR